MLGQQEGKPKQSWVNSHDLSAGKQAKTVLDRMLDFHEAGDPNVNPDTISLSSVINAWANGRDSSAGRQPEAIFGKQLLSISLKAS
jgi:hypothetical protein